MPCEVVSRIVNSTYTKKAVELELDSPQKGTMYEPRVELCRPTTPIESGRHGKLVEKCCQEDLEMVESSGQIPNPKRFHKEISYHVFGYRSLPRVFSGGEFGVIEETESADDDVCVSLESSSVPLLQQNHNLRRKSPTNVATKARHGAADWLTSSSSSAKNNYLRRSSEGSVYVVSARVDGRSGEYRNYSDPILREQRSEREENNDILEQVNETRSSRLVNGSSRSSSFAAMNAIPETLADNQRYYSLPRKLSLPDENNRSPAIWNGKKQRNSFLTNSGGTGTFALDNDTDFQWEMLVARAKNFQKMSSKEPTRKSSFEDVKTRKETKDLETESVDHHRGVICDKQVIQITNSKENHKSNETTKSQEKLKGSKISDDIEFKESSSMHLTGEKEVGNPGQVDLTVKKDPNKHDFDPQPRQIDKSIRRYSLATVRPSPEVREKISGYSTHGALEYAKTLLGKILSEGKSKSKKERLEEMSKALKLVLEELNRIDSPDRELVSLFISLRAKIVNLKAELKAEETQEPTSNGKETDSNARFLAQTLPRVRSTSESVINRQNFRRFSWC